MVVICPTGSTASSAIEQALFTAAHQYANGGGERNPEQLIGIDAVPVVDSDDPGSLLEGKCNGLRFTLAQAKVRFQFGDELRVSYKDDLDTRFIQHSLDHECIK